MAKSTAKDIASRHNAHARAIGCDGAFSAEEWTALCARFDDRCVACGIDGTMTVDHIVPMDAGGSNSIDNIQPLCNACNARKGAATTDYRQSPASPRAGEPTKSRRQSRGINRHHINLTDEQLCALQEMADKKGVSFSVIIGLALGEYYEAHHKVYETHTDV